MGFHRAGFAPFHGQSFLAVLFSFSLFTGLSALCFELLAACCKILQDHPFTFPYPATAGWFGRIDLNYLSAGAG